MARTLRYVIVLVTVFVASCGRPSESQPKNVFGSDARRDVKSHEYPWSTLGMMDPGCTGTLVARDLVLTASHCVWDASQGQLLSLLSYFQPNLIDGRAADAAWVDWVWFGTKDYNNDRGHDWAIVHINKPLGDKYKWMGVLPETFANLPFAVNMAGYSADRSGGNSASTHLGCFIRRIDGERLLNDCDATEGASGGPVFIMRQGAPYIVALFVSEYRDGGPSSLRLPAYADNHANVAISAKTFAPVLATISQALASGMSPATVPQMPGVNSAPNPNNPANFPGMGNTGPGGTPVPPNPNPVNPNPVNPNPVNPNPVNPSPVNPNPVNPNPVNPNPVNPNPVNPNPVNPNPVNPSPVNPSPVNPNPVNPNPVNPNPVNPNPVNPNPVNPNPVNPNPADPGPVGTKPLPLPPASGQSPVTPPPSGGVPVYRPGAQPNQPIVLIPPGRAGDAVQIANALAADASTMVQLAWLHSDSEIAGIAQSLANASAQFAAFANQVQLGQLPPNAPSLTWTYANIEQAYAAYIAFFVAHHDEVVDAQTWSVRDRTMVDHEQLRGLLFYQ